LALTSDGKWQVDDNNYTTLPIATTDVVSGQQDYSLDDAAMEIETVFIKNSAGDWQEVRPVDITGRNTDSPARNIWRLPTNDAGVPTGYDKVGRSLFFSAIPNYNSTGGLKVVFKRGPSYFVSGDTTKEPGIPVIFHNYIYRYAAWTYLADKNPKKASLLYPLLARDEEAITDFFAHREKDEPTRIRFVQRRSSR
jgi:hypothetical protein